MNAPTSSPDRWHALATRDRRADGSFVYAVQTTGVFCRPSCAARTPKPENVVFFETPADALAAGFRGCKKCRPGHPAGSPAEETVARVQVRIDTADAPILLGELAAEAGWSTAHLQKTFTRIVGLSPRRYAEARRLEKAKAALHDGQTVLEATFGAGFGSANALYETGALGMTPGAYRRNGAGETVTYGVFATGLGALLVAATARGLCAVTLGDTAGPLEAALRDTFARATLVRDEAAVAEHAHPIVRYVNGTAPGDTLLALPLDARGTDFQQQVWHALRQIPCGETRSYADVAHALGRPTATRAVAQACGANPVALVVPCHRVVGSDGRLRGYRWGTERKRALLGMEAG